MNLRSLLSVAVLFTACLCSAPVLGQGVLIVHNHDHVWLPRPIPRPAPPPVSYKIKELGVNARVKDQVAQVQVTQSFVNTGSRQMEVSFVFPLPYDGAVDELTFLVDGKEYAGKLLPAKEARSIYEGYMRRNQDPALLEWMGTGMFKTSIFPVPPGAERKVTLKYTQLLRKDNALTDFVFPLSTAKYTSHAVETLSIRATIESAAKIKSVYSPTHDVKIKRSDNRHALVTYEAKNAVPDNDFRLFYDNHKADVGASLISYRPEGEQGYFLLLASPDIEREQTQAIRKTVILVVDRSGSMSGKKIEQAREALRFVLNNLHENDLFNIIAYDSSVESFRPELQKYNKKSRQEALHFVDEIYAGGSTNINDALGSALGMIQDSSTPNYVVFLTDGRPTAGETNEMKIAQNTKAENHHGARVISLGVGYDVNSRLLDRLTHDHRGRTDFVRPDEDLEEHVSRLYESISAPVMTDVKVVVDVEDSKRTVNRVYPKETPDLFAGEQLVLVGRYKDHGDAKITITGKVGDDKQKLDFGAELVKKSNDETYAFVERLWAMRRVGEIIDEIDLHGKNSELIDELVDLSTKHGIITPYTSFLADDQAPVRELASAEGLRRRAATEFDALEAADGVEGLAQRSIKNQLRMARQLSDQFADRSRPNAPAGLPGGGAGGRGGAAPPAATTPANAFGGAIIHDAKSDLAKRVEGIRQVGKDVLYRRGQLLIAPNARDVKLDNGDKDIVEVKRFSDEYFRLAQDNTHSENQLLAAQQEGEELIIRLRGKVYRIK
ncbi:MAG: VWA domain-containing protein [Planctomycetales bacterium]|nr:VWA domain-containing protein [Planctomycetales bacterium]